MPPMVASSAWEWWIPTIVTNVFLRLRISLRRDNLLRLSRKVCKREAVWWCVLNLDMIPKFAPKSPDQAAYKCDKEAPTDNFKYIPPTFFVFCLHISAQLIHFPPFLFIKQIPNSWLFLLRFWLFFLLFYWRLLFLRIFLLIRSLWHVSRLREHGHTDRNDSSQHLI